MSKLEFPLEDGFLAQKILKNDFTVYDKAQKIVKLIIQGREQVDTGKLRLNAVEASNRYLQFVFYKKERQIEEDDRIILFDLLTFSGNYRDYWGWLVDRVVQYQGEKFYDEY